MVFTVQPPVKYFTVCRRVGTNMPLRVSFLKLVDQQLLIFWSHWWHESLLTVFIKVIAICPVSSLPMEFKALLTCRHMRPLVFFYYLLSVSTARLVGMQIVHPQLPRTPLHVAIIAMFACKGLPRSF